VTEQPAPGIGQTFGGYTLDSLLGRGGMGTVYLATHKRLGRKVALKLISPELAHDEAFRARFLRESELAASLDHPNVIPIYDADEIDGVLYLAMRYVDGPSLQAWIRERGALSHGEALRLAEQIGGALDAAHGAGLVHRDVKPANILLAEPGRHAYLCDFGLAKRTSSHGMTQVGSFLGSVDYCSPEQIRGGPLDGRADVYSLGCVLFHCLAGRPPYARDGEIEVLHAHLHDSPPALSDVRADVPPALDAVLTRAMAKPPDDRFPRAGILAAAFADALGAPTIAARTGVATEAGEIAAPPRPRVPRRRGRLLAALLLVGIAGAVAAAAVVGTRGTDGGSTTAGPAAAKLRTFVDRIENVLVQAAAGRREVRTALTGGLNCSISPSEAAVRIASVADNRQSILGQLGSLPTPTQRSDTVVTLLQQALQDSIEADRHYRDGFALVPPGTRCPLPSNPGFALAAQSNSQATAAKQRFVAAFDPLARRFGRREWAPGGF
jgi:predicted Ser/Thr protein kinase